MIEFDQRLREMLNQDEDRVPYAYPDSLGYLTIGVGHLVDVRRDGGLPEHIIDALLEYDIEEKERELYAVFPWVVELDEPRRATLINMAFQLGVTGLRRFIKAMDAMRRHDWSAAAAHFLDSTVAREQTPERWQRHAKRIITGEWH